MKKLVIIVPCYNEEEVLPTTISVLSGILQELIRNEKIDNNSALLFVNDGSKDNTWQIVLDAHNINKSIYGINLAKNVGHQYALLAGLDYAKDRYDMSITIDADLQDDVNAISEMVDEFINGADIVYGVRSDRKKDSIFKRSTAQGYYKLMNHLGANTVYNHADYRLLSKTVMQELSKYKESNLFLRGIISNIGFNTRCVYYARKERIKGESKYTLGKMLKLAWDGITSFSIRPMTIIMVVGLLIVCCSIVALIYSLISYFCGSVVSGWTSLIISIWFLGGANMLSVGIIGQYVGKTYIESKQRPRYIVKEYLVDEKNGAND